MCSLWVFIKKRVPATIWTTLYFNSNCPISVIFGIVITSKYAMENFKTLKSQSNL